MRALRNRGLDEFGKLQLELIAEMDSGKISRTEAQKKVEEYWMGALKRAAIEGDVTRGSLMGGAIGRPCSRLPAYQGNITYYYKWH